MSRIIFSYYYGLKFSIRHPPLTLLSLYFDSLAILFILSVIEGEVERHCTYGVNCIYINPLRLFFCR